MGKHVTAAAALRRCLGMFTTGVTVVTYALNGEPRGVTVNSFTAASLEPPLILICLQRSARAAEALPGRPFTVNVLSAPQSPHALHFAGRAQDGLEVGWQREGTRLRLAESLAWLSCLPWESRPAGDHLLVLGEVEEMEVHSGDPLVFYRGRFCALEAPDPGPADWNSLIVESEQVHALAAADRGEMGW